MVQPATDADYFMSSELIHALRKHQGLLVTLSGLSTSAGSPCENLAVFI